jgi:hypothetical protein
MESFDPYALTPGDWVCFQPYKGCALAVCRVSWVSEYNGDSTDLKVIEANTWYGTVMADGLGALTLLPSMILATVPPPVPEE